MSDKTPEISTLLRVWKLAGDLRRPLALAISFRFAQSFALGLAYATAIWVVTGLISGDEMTTKWAAQISALMAISLAGQLIFSFLSVSRAWDASFQIGKHLRLELLAHLARLPMGFHLSRHKGDSLTLLTADIAMIEGFLSDGLAKVIQALSLPFMALIFMGARDWVLGLAMFASICTAIPVSIYLRHRFGNFGLQRQTVQAEAGGVMVEYMQGIDVIRSYNQVAEGQSRFRAGLDKFRAVSIQMVVTLVVPMLSFAAVIMLGMPLLVAVAGLRLSATPEADLTIALVLMFSVYGPLIGLVSVVERIRIAEASLDRLEDVLLAKPLPVLTPTHDPSDSAITLEKVGFAYAPDAPVLKEISFTAPPRSMTAIVGPSGSGKSTILNLVARFWDVTEGILSIGGADVRHIPSDKHRDLVSMVFQDVYLFGGTIRDNIAAGREGATQVQIESAARKAQAHDFISNLPQGYDTEVGEGGAHLSGGEQQRVSIARAILKDAPIILLDEATAALDPSNDLAIQRALAALVSEKTLIIVAHKLTTIRAADQILVLDQGSIAERGNHDRLIAKGGLYAKMIDRKTKAANWRTP
ncbi:ABC transporter ATP-binding protein [Shimia sp. MMG029]|uniref:ABC transporter ATP-binding protein n=1 Tax=Shimia sp. MMG029 TaxID=3021978 RepID=UPI0022FE0403|nr:ABC transporter ATP-binding protein [Shimia sp. MMG029]MDA5558706.1 ABC transporter ATP-binding protein [Shimia sp. MMG029]